MPTIEHSTLGAGEIHEPKGITSASSGQVYVADGASSGEWIKANPMGGWRYTDIGTGTTFTTPTSYTLMNVASTTTHVSDFTHNSLGRLTYTGTPDRHCRAVVAFSFKHSSGGGNDCYFAIYKNGSILGTPNVEIVRSADSNTYDHTALHFDSTASTNDYFECYLKVTSGSITIHQAYMFMMGLP
jgi:hypothetical protein